MCAGGRYFRFNPSAYIENKRKQQKDINERFQLVLTTSSLTSILNQVYSSTQETMLSVFPRQRNTLSLQLAGEGSSHGQWRKRRWCEATSSEVIREWVQEIVG